MPTCAVKECDRIAYIGQGILCSKCYRQGMLSLSRLHSYKEYVRGHHDRLESLVHESRSYMRRGWTFNANH